MMTRQLISALIISAISAPAIACTGITLNAKDNSIILARTIEWGSSALDSHYVVVPRGYKQTSYLPDGSMAGMEFTARHGYIGMSIEQKEFVVEGLNEQGLSAGLFYFPGYGKYEDYKSDNSSTTISDLQLVSWMLGNFTTVDQVKNAIRDIHITSVDPRGGTVHWRIADASGHQVVLEIVDGKPTFYENKLGVITNSPGFQWHLTNLNNYVNLYPGAAPDQKLGAIQLRPFGAGSGFLGMPGDVTPPSRFVRAAFYQTSADQQPNAQKTVFQAFHILNNFDIPVGIEFPIGKVPVDIPSATQWTSVTDLTHGVIYYHTMYNNTIRKIDIADIDFTEVKYQAKPLDATKQQPVITIEID